MPRKKTRKKTRVIKSKRRGFVTLLLVALVVGLGLLMAGSFIPDENFSKDGKPAGNVIPQPPQSSQNNLELKPLAFEESKECDFDSEVTDGCLCPSTQFYPPYHTDEPEQECYFVDDTQTKVNDECTLLKLCEKNEGQCNWNADGGCIIPRSITGKFVEPGVEGQPFAVPNLSCSDWRNNLASGKHWCVGKPVIYLYPETPTLVDVELSIPGEIYISIPKYPNEGWQDVYAEPDGTLTYEGKTYKELYYETKVTVKKIPQNGIIIPTSKLPVRLWEYTGKLGLRSVEQQEFLDYWLPLLYELDKPYIVFSLIEQAEKERIDGVTISPKPDVFINFIAYFKGVDYPVALNPLVLPQTPPGRHGFTAVEWGGTIDQN